MAKWLNATRTGVVDLRVEADGFDEPPQRTREAIDDAAEDVASTKHPNIPEHRRRRGGESP